MKAHCMVLSVITALLAPTVLSAHPGTLLGLFPGRVAIHGGEALTDITVWLVPHDNLAPLIEAHPGIGLRLAWIIWRERNLAYEANDRFIRCARACRLARAQCPPRSARHRSLRPSRTAPEKKPRRSPSRRGV